MRKIVKIPVRFSDLDAMGHVNNAVYLNYFEQARMSYFKEVVDADWDWKKDGVIVARNEIDYQAPLLLQDYVLVEVELESIGTKSITVTYVVFDDSPSGRKIYAMGRTVIVCYDHELEKTVPVPEHWRSVLTVAE